MAKRIISILSLVLVLTMCLTCTTSCLLVWEGLKELENQQGGETPDEPGEGGETPDEPGEGGETPDEPGEGGETPDEPGEHVNTLAVGPTNKIVVSGDTLNDYDLPIEWVAFYANSRAHYEFVGDNGALVFIFSEDGAPLCGFTGKADLDEGYYLICIGNGSVGEINVAVTQSDIVTDEPGEGGETPDEPAHVNKLEVGKTNEIYIDGSVVNAWSQPITWVEFVVTEKANYKFACAETGALALIYASDYATNLCAFTGAADLEPGTYYICVGGGAVGMFNVTVTKTDIVPTLDLNNLQLWVSDGSLYTVDGYNIKYNGAGNTYACVGTDVTTFAAGNNTFTITITNNGAAIAKVRVDLQGINKVGNHKVVNTGATGGDVWTDSDWGGSHVHVAPGESVTLVITFDENTERGAVKDLIVFADSGRGDGETYSADITISSLAFSNVTPEPEAPHVNTLAVGDTNKIVVSGNTVNAQGAPIEWVTFVVEEKAHYEFVGDNGAVALIFSSGYELLCSGTGKADLEAGTYLICLGNGAVGEFNVAVTKSEIVVVPEEVKPIVNVSNLAVGTTTDAELIAGTGIYASAGLTIEENPKSVDGFDFTKRLKTGGGMKLEGGVVKAALRIDTTGAAKIIVYCMSSSSNAERVIQIATSGETLNVLSTIEGVGGAALAKYEFYVTEAGTYYFGSASSGLNIYYVAVDYDASHTHAWSDATCKELSKCSCGATQGELAACTPGAEATCTTAQVCTVCDKELVKALEHNYVDGVCDRAGCGAEEPAGGEEGGETPATKEVFKYETAGDSISKNTVIYSGDAFSVKWLEKSAATTATTATAEDGTEFTVCLLPSGSGGGIDITANKSGKITVYVTVTDGSFSSKSATVTYGDKTIDIKSEKGVAYVLELNVEAGQTYTVKASANRFALFGVVFE